MKRLLISLALIIFASSLNAAELGKRGKKEYMGACSRQNPAELYSITNGSNAESCSDEQTVGSVTILCQCLSDDGETFVWTKVGGGTSPDLSAYVLLAGDADGQVIQGFTGADKARIDIGVADASGIRLIGTGAAAGFIYAYTDGVFASSPDLGTSFDLYDSGIDIVSDGSSLFYGETATNIGVEGGPTSINGSRVNVASFQTPPTNANDPCTVGDTIDTATFHYYCHATDTWVRVGMVTWP